MIYDSILHTIGRTPVVRVNRIAPAHVTMYVKCEYFNPLSSVKDRLAIAIIEDGERSGALKPGQTVVEATSGNTGIALAMVGAMRGYKVVIVMPKTVSQERRSMITSFGAELQLLDEIGEEWSRGGIEIRHEHFFSEVLEDEIRLMRVPLQVSAGGRPVVTCRRRSSNAGQSSRCTVTR